MRLRTFGHEDAASAAGPKLEQSVADIVQNKAITDFLSDDNKCYVIGPKGTGKTLLLIRKALDRITNQSICVVPHDSDLPVDMLTVQEHLGKKFWQTTKDRRDSSLAWTAVWMNAILKAALYNLCDTAGRPSVCLPSFPKDLSHDLAFRYEKQIAETLRGDLDSIFGPPPYVRHRAVYSFYAETLHNLDSAGVKSIPTITAENDKLTNLLRDSNKPVYLFIDNLDKHYELLPELWFQSMEALFRVIRDIRRQLRHIHVFTSIRKDIYNRFATEQITQFDDYIAFLDYTRAEVLRVFEHGIARLEDTLLSIPALRKDDPWHAFFGNAVNIENLIVSQQTEKIQDYVFRHSLWRPRDLVLLGNRILTAKGDAPMTADSVRNGVSDAAALICRQYLEEIRPSIPAAMSVKYFVREFLGSNILTREDAEMACAMYTESLGTPCAQDCHKCDGPHPVCALYSVGLIGAVTQSTVTGKVQQTFLKPGERPAVEGRERIPHTRWYVVHPVLYEILGNERINKSVVVGYDQEFYEGAL